MDNNDVLRRLRYALDISDRELIEVWKLAGYDIPKPDLERLFKAEEEAGYLACEDSMMAGFLEGLVVSRRGRRDGPQGKPERPGGARLFNNDILKRIRVALELRDEDIVGIMGLAGVEISKSELSALFRKPGHPNYRPCGDQFLRNFLVGLTSKLRP